MAIVRELKHLKIANSYHSEVNGSYSIILDKSGKKYLQIDTYGSTNRKILGKKSQTIRFSPEAVKVLAKIISKEFEADM
jgi:hypothetical protein